VKGLNSDQALFVVPFSLWLGEYDSIAQKHTFTMVAIDFGGQSNKGENGKRDDETIGDSDVKIIIIGDSGVGKSKLVERYVNGDYDPRRLSTHALSIHRKAVNNGKDGNNSTAIVDFWDTAGREKFNSVHSAYYYQANACILVFDVTRKESYVNLENWYLDLRKYCPNIPCIVVANKVDVDYMVIKKNFEFPREHNLPFFFASSADGMNVVTVFNEAVRAGLDQRKYGEKDFLTECLQLFNNNPLQRELQHRDHEKR
jgi:Rab-like protein 2